jgi:hypothetical protein
VSNDILHVATILKPPQTDKGKQNTKHEIIHRKARGSILTEVHYGRVASSKSPITNGALRDRLADKFDCLCFDTSLAGLAKDFPCLVIRGISDYADAYTDTRWQGYAAMTAASYAKEFLLHLPATRVNNEISPAAPFPLIDSYTQKVQLENSKVRIPVNWQLSKIGRADAASIGWQDYWHSTALLPFDPREMEYQKRISNDEFRELATKLTNVRDITENKLAKTMQKYRDILLVTVRKFPNIQEQRCVFMCIMDATEGLFHDDGETKRTLLHYFAMNNVAELLPALVDAGFGVDAPDSDRCTALHLAVASNHWESTQVLIENCGANVQARDLNNLLPWHYALHVDEGATRQHPQRLESVTKILRLLARHTDIALVTTAIPRLILSQLKANPDDEIAFVTAAK